MIDIIDLDSPQKPTRRHEPARPSATAEALDLSSDESLPDILPTGTAVRGPPSRRAHSAPKFSLHTRQNDPIQTSSPAVASRARATHRPHQEVIDLDSSSSVDDAVGNVQSKGTALGVPPVAQPSLQRAATVTLPLNPKPAEPLQATTISSNLLDTIDSIIMRKTNTAKRAKTTRTSGHVASQSQTMDDTEDEGDDDDDGPSQPKRASKTKAKSSTTSEQKLQLKQQKQAEKERLKLEKAQAKEAALQQKRVAQSIAAVNVLKKTKKDSTPEMVVDVCSSIEKSALYTHISSFMEGLGCAHHLVVMPVPGLVKFRRKVVAEYDAEKRHWVPIAERLVDEDHLMVMMKAQEFLRLVGVAGGLQRHVASVKRIRPQARVLYIIEGLTAAIRKSQNAKNRAFQAAVRANGIVAGETSISSDTARGLQQDIDEAIVEDALLDLQVVHNCLIVHSTSAQDSAEQLSILVSDMSTIPYKKERESRSAQFCMETGQIKTGSDLRDTFEKMLQAITRVTPQVAQAVAARYSGVKELSEALAAGPHVVARIPKGHNIDGAVSHQVLGVATAQKIHRALTTMDPHAEA